MTDEEKTWSLIRPTIDSIFGASIHQYLYPLLFFFVVPPFFPLTLHLPRVLKRDAAFPTVSQGLDDSHISFMVLDRTGGSFLTSPTRKERHESQPEGKSFPCIDCLEGKVELQELDSGDLRGIGYPTLDILLPSTHA
ncbi:hypothetical protein K505DRAFT_51379 [Melanomma pulvis-pyrius CBS 109.77]|uniref:Uncharacterized protein n=1 Tax=Melanomma pulvis-pyrius CBS 109.77 TaxID=1314802 RepID=A0A6A6X894_9PLEO|nr:hypothetical protein K505DRAFT_51379 [Melanomma pulvis-pyrius CBS 109.77]